jgi:hypothetical protein
MSTADAAVESASSGSGQGVEQTTGPGAESVRTESVRAERLFSKSIVVSGIRCLLAYIVLPFVTPFIGLAPGVGAGFGLVIGLVAIAANLFSIRRFWRADHRWKLPVTVLHVAVIGLLVVLVINDIRELMG